MFMGFCALLVLVAVPLMGGDLRRLGELRLRWAGLVLLALAVQVVVISLTPDGNRTVQGVAHSLTYVVALAVVFANRRLPGMVLIGLGTFANGLAISLNGGTLPSSVSALAVSDMHKWGGGLENSAPQANPHLPWLGDQFVSPSFLPFRNVVSVGDVLILVGAFVLVWVTTRRVAAAPARPHGAEVSSAQNSAR